MKTLFDKKDVEKMDELNNLLKDFTPEEQRELVIFLQGIKFAKNVVAEKEPA